MKSFALSLVFIMRFTAARKWLIFLFDHAWIRYRHVFAYNAAKSTTVTVKIRDFINFVAAALFRKKNQTAIW